MSVLPERGYRRSHVDSDTVYACGTANPFSLGHPSSAAIASHFTLHSVIKVAWMR